MSPSRSKTISRPSGLTSSDIQVPSVTSMIASCDEPGGFWTSHLGLSGVVGAAAAVESLAGAFCANAGKATARAATVVNKLRFMKAPKPLELRSQGLAGAEQS